MVLLTSANSLTRWAVSWPEASRLAIRGLSLYGLVRVKPFSSQGKDNDKNNYRFPVQRLGVHVDHLRIGR
jgi:hypothetical protein